MIPGRLQPGPRLRHRILPHPYGGMFALANWATDMDFSGRKIEAVPQIISTERDNQRHLTDE